MTHKKLKSVAFIAFEIFRKNINTLPNFVTVWQKLFPTFQLHFLGFFNEITIKLITLPNSLLNFDQKRVCQLFVDFRWMIYQTIYVTKIKFHNTNMKMVDIVDGLHAIHNPQQRCKTH